ncbi:hypothetical protein P8605_31520, partial [Streptomyces sp. T-3]|nr:hypothetical protein [Streptomyces sp. T-3]
LRPRRVLHAGPRGPRPRIRARRLTAVVDRVRARRYAAVVHRLCAQRLRGIVHRVRGGFLASRSGILRP